MAETAEMLLIRIASTIDRRQSREVCSRCARTSAVIPRWLIVHPDVPNNPHSWLLCYLIVVFVSARMKSVTGRQGSLNRNMIWRSMYNCEGTNDKALTVELERELPKSRVSDMWCCHDWTGLNGGFGTIHGKPRKYVYIQSLFLN